MCIVWICVVFMNLSGGNVADENFSAKTCVSIEEWHMMFVCDPSSVLMWLCVASFAILIGTSCLLEQNWTFIHNDACVPKSKNEEHFYSFWVVWYVKEVEHFSSLSCLVANVYLTCG